MGENCFKNIGVASAIVVVMIVIYAVLITLIFKTKDRDPLIRLRSPILGNIFNGWGFTHLIYFSYLGYRYPDCFVHAQLSGILWEMFEYFAGASIPYFFPGWAYSIDPFWDSWYYGCWEDILMNIIGFLIGRYIRQRIKPNQQVESESRSP